MAAIIRLEDGRGLYGSTVSISGMLYLISQKVSDQYSVLKRWLADVSDRPAPFLDIDVGGIDSENRVEFYKAAQRAHESVLRDDTTLVERSHAVQQLSRLLAMQSSIERGEPPLSLSDTDYVLEPRGAVDMNQLWGG